jgi:hypothetical protein
MLRSPPALTWLATTVVEPPDASAVSANAFADEP